MRGFVIHFGDSFAHGLPLEFEAVGVVNDAVEDSVWKTDAADAEAICEAVTRPTMRFVAVKTPEQQAVPMLHKTRDLLVRQRTGLINALRAHLGEYGIISSKGPGGVTTLVKLVHEAQHLVPAHARSALHTIASQLRGLADEIERLEMQIIA